METRTTGSERGGTMSRSRDTSQVQDNGASAVAPFVAAKNKIINGDFGVWQRNTSFNLVSGTNTYTADRFVCQQTFTSGTGTVTQQTFTPATAPVSGYEGTYFFRHTLATGNLYFYVGQRVEDVRAFSGQTVTFSFWAKSSSSISALTVYFQQNFGSGGSTTVTNTTTTTAIGTSWTRYTVTYAVPSISGKTVGTGSFLMIGLDTSNSPTLSNGQTFDTWGWQLEAGSVATPFTTATGTVQGELAACKRYYYKLTNGTVYAPIGLGAMLGTTQMELVVPFGVEMRTPPALDQTTGTAYYYYQSAGGNQTFNSLTIDRASTNQCALYAILSSTTAGYTGMVFAYSTSSYLAFTAEL